MVSVISCSFYLWIHLWRSTRNMHVFKFIFFFYQDISFAINDLERWLFSLLTCLLLIHACYNFLFLVSMKGQHKNMFALLVVSARASPFTKLGFFGGGGGGVKFSFRVISPWIFHFDLFDLESWHLFFKT